MVAETKQNLTISAGVKKIKKMNRIIIAFETNNDSNKDDFCILKLKNIFENLSNFVN